MALFIFCVHNIAHLYSSGWTLFVCYLNVTLLNTDYSGIFIEPILKKWHVYEYIITKEN